MALLFTDLVGFSSWALRVGDAVVLELLREVGTAVEDAITSYDGRIVKRLGDGVMATFLSGEAAVTAALDAQDAVNGIEVDGYSPRMRAGIHWGRPRKLGGDYLGVDVNVAARVAAAAKAEQVLVSEALLTQIDGDGLRTGKAKRLRADGAPSDLRVIRGVARVERAPRRASHAGRGAWRPRRSSRNSCSLHVFLQKTSDAVAKLPGAVSVAAARSAGRRRHSAVRAWSETAPTMMLRRRPLTDATCATLAVLVVVGAAVVALTLELAGR